MMYYQSFIKKLFHLSSHEVGEKKFASFKKMVSLLNHPEKNYPTIHIAGTNGKGSVAYKIAQALLAARYHVGLYTSPHLIDYRERIVVDDEQIGENEVVDFLTHMITFAKKKQMNLNFFDLTTLLAFDFFAKKKVDIAIIETGIGGRFDSTNVIVPLLSVITSIGIDHQNILGKSLTSIAYQKGGIIKEKRPVILGPYANFPIFQKIAKKKDSPIYHVPLKQSAYDMENQEIALKALEVLNPYFPTSFKERKKGISMRPKCRFQIFQKNVILDGAHNQDGFHRLFQEIKKKYPKKVIDLLFAQSIHKALGPLIEMFSFHVRQIALFSSRHTKLKSPYLIAQEFEKMQFHRWKIYSHFKEAFSQISLDAKENGGIVLIAGSFYMMQEALDHKTL